MALLSKLVSTIAAVEGIDEGQVTWVARHLREAGLITQAGRGRGAAHMTINDATNLLIGVNAAASAKEASEAVADFRMLVCTPRNFSGNLFEDIFIYGINLGDSLDMLIDKAIPDDLGNVDLRWRLFIASDYLDRLEAKPIALERWTEVYKDHGHYVDQIVKTEIVFDRQSRNVAVIFENTGLLWKDGPVAPPPEDEDQKADREIVNAIFHNNFVRSRRLGDRKDRVAISINTILAVGETLAA